MRLLVSGKRSSLKRIKTHLDVIGLRELGVPLGLNKNSIRAGVC